MLYNKDENYLLLLNTCFSGNIKEAKKLLEKYNRVNGLEKLYINTGTPLTSALAGGHKDLAKYLIEKGADVNRITFGISGFAAPLHCLISYEGDEEDPEDVPDEDMVRFLVEECGADPNLETGLGETALKIAIQVGHKPAEKYLRSIGAKEMPEINKQYFNFIYYCESGHINFFNETFREEFINGLREENEIQILPIIATLNNINNIDKLKFMIKKGANLNKINTWYYGPVASLHYAIASKSKQEILKILIESGANVNLLDGEGRAPLDWAINTNNKPAEELLLYYGAKTAKELGKE